MRISQNFRTPKISFLLLPLSPANFFLTQNFRTPKFFVLRKFSESENFWFFQDFCDFGLRKFSYSENFRIENFEVTKIWTFWAMLSRSFWENGLFWAILSRYFYKFHQKFQIFCQKYSFSGKTQNCGAPFLLRGAPARRRIGLLISKAQHARGVQGVSPWWLRYYQIIAKI